jgi:hypothetical protein
LPHGSIFTCIFSTCFPSGRISIIEAAGSGVSFACSSMTGAFGL